MNIVYQSFMFHSSRADSPRHAASGICIAFPAFLQARLVSNASS